MMSTPLGRDKIFPQHLKGRREFLGLSRRQVAKKIGKSGTYIGNIENAEAIPTYDFLIMLADVYDEDPVPYLVWRAQAKGEYDMHRWLTSVQVKLRRRPPLRTVSMAAEAQGKYPDNTDGGEQAHKS